MKPRFIPIQVEAQIQEDWQLLVRDIYAFYPLLIKYVDLQRNHWLKHNIAEAEEMYNYVADIFNIWSKSQVRLTALWTTLTIIVSLRPLESFLVKGVVPGLILVFAALALFRLGYVYFRPPYSLSHVFFCQEVLEEKLELPVTLQKVDYFSHPSSDLSIFWNPFKLQSQENLGLVLRISSSYGSCVLQTSFN